MPRNKKKAERRNERRQTRQNLLNDKLVEYSTEEALPWPPGTIFLLRFPWNRKAVPASMAPLQLQEDELQEADYLIS